MPVLTAEHTEDPLRGVVRGANNPPQFANFKESKSRICALFEPNSMLPCSVSNVVFLTTWLRQLTWARDV